MNKSIKTNGVWGRPQKVVGKLTTRVGKDTTHWPKGIEIPKGILDNDETPFWTSNCQPAADLPTLAAGEKLGVATIIDGLVTFPVRVILQGEINIAAKAAALLALQLSDDILTRNEEDLATLIVELGGVITPPLSEKIADKVALRANYNALP